MKLNPEEFMPNVCDEYDSRLLDKRQLIEGNVCGCLLKDLDLFDECTLVTEDFVTYHGRMMYSIVKQLHDKGVKKFDEVTFISILPSDFVTMINETYGGYGQIYNLMNAVDSKNWDSYLEDLNKNNILLRLFKKGFNIFDKITLENGREAIPFDLFKAFSSTEVIEFYEGSLASMQVKLNNQKLIEEGYIEFDDEWIDSLKRKEEMGVSYGEAGMDVDGELIRTFPFMSNNTLGLKPGTMSAWGSLSGVGKTSYMVTIAMSLASKGEKVVMVTNESYLRELKAIFLTWVIYRILKYDKLSKRKLLSGDFSVEDLSVIKKAQKYWKEHYEKQIKIITLSDADANFSCQVIKRAILREGASVFIVDTMKMTLSDDVTDNSWISLIKDVRALTEVAMKYNVIGIITVQLAPSTANRTWLDVSCLANCKQIKETLSNLILFRKLRAVELDPNSPFFIHPFRRKQKDDGSGEWYDEPYDADPNKTWIIAFTDKNRRGTDSGMDGTAFLCRTDLDHASFYETARCYPTNRSFSPNER